MAKKRITCEDCEEQWSTHKFDDQDLCCSCLIKQSGSVGTLCAECETIISKKSASKKQPAKKTAPLPTAVVGTWGTDEPLRPAKSVQIPTYEQQLAIAFDKLTYFLGDLQRSLDASREASDDLATEKASMTEAISSLDETLDKLVDSIPDLTDAVKALTEAIDKTREEKEESETQGQN